MATRTCILVVFLVGTQCCLALTPDAAVCEMEGVTYEDGEQIPTQDNCLRCYCAPLLPDQVSCVAVMCAFPMCVDAQYDEHGCCMGCPHGKNCLHQGNILSGDDKIEFVDGDCETICSCPATTREYFKHGRNTQAICHSTCA